MTSWAVIDTRIVVEMNIADEQDTLASRYCERVSLLARCYKGDLLIRLNSKLLREYKTKAPKTANDYVEAFFAILDNRERARMVKRNKLEKKLHVKCNECRFPSHDQHLLAAAVLDADESGSVTIFVAEKAHTNCAPCIWRKMGTRLTAI